MLINEFMPRKYREEAGNDGDKGGGNWRDGLSDNLKGNESLANFKDVEQLASSFVEMKGFQGNSIRIPSEDAGDEDKKLFVDKILEKAPNIMFKPDFDNAEQSEGFYRSLGRPSEVAGYEVPDVEGVDKEKINSEKIDFFRDIALKNNLTKSQFKGVMSEIISADANSAQTQKKAIDENITAVKQEWGHAYGENRNTTLKIAELTKAPESLVNAIKSGSASPEVVKWIYSLSQKFAGEGTELSGQLPSKTEVTPLEAREKISEIMNNKEHPYWKGSDPGHQDALMKMVKLHERANAQAA